MIKKFLAFLLFFSVVFAASACFADTIYFKDGRTLEGKIVSRTDKLVKFDVKGVVLTYFANEIEKLEAGGVAVPSTGVSASSAIPLTRPSVVSPVAPARSGSSQPSSQAVYPSTGGASLGANSKEALVLELIDGGEFFEYCA